MRKYSPTLVWFLQKNAVFRWCLLLLAAACSSVPVTASAEDFLAPEQAFIFSSTSSGPHTLRLHWEIAPGYHLYRERISATTADNNPSPLLALPRGIEKFDDTLNKTMAVFERELTVDLELAAGTSATVNWQGCADAGLCYAPASAQVRMAGVSAAPPKAPAVSLPAPVDSIGSALASGNMLRTMGVFWLAGLLLSFTPCVLPMVPILSSLIAGQGGHVSRARGFQLALAYAFGMALVYAGFGVAAGLAGEGLAAALQNRWVLGAFALLLSAMALSMFGLYDLQMPGAIQTRANAFANRFRGGSYVGVFIMGGVSAIMVGPCVAAPLAGALVYISQTRDVVLGGAALFAMALGMSVPLLLVGLSAGSLLPRAGAWMENVKRVFGMMLLAVAIWMVTPVLPASAQMLLWAAWMLTGAALLGLFGAAGAQPRSVPVASRAGGAALAALALLLLIGAVSGGDSVLQPLGHLRAGPASTSVEAAHPSLRFERIADTAALDAALVQSQQRGQAVMLDFYADWCVSCKEYENLTFSNPAVRQRLREVRLLQVDVTANSDADKALLKRFNLFGPPGIVLFKHDATSEATQKVVGYQNATEFLASLERAGVP
ncbi:protein-disulfide reductase DsbD [Massilia sp. PWRC2]|uniref:protein-disulfide reductase DsbD n=1 Tax=Massilia sp. PWRC2 TaxID=2804626 RepID=UPI003CF64C80